MIALNDNIKILRTARGMSQVELAEKLNVSKQCVSNWENDNVQPSIEMLIKLSDFFNVSTDQLLGRTSEATIDVTGLSEEQRAHINLIVNDMIQINKNNS